MAMLFRNFSSLLVSLRFLRFTLTEKFSNKYYKDTAPKRSTFKHKTIKSRIHIWMLKWMIPSKCCNDVKKDLVLGLEEQLYYNYKHKQKKKTLQ